MLLFVISHYLHADLLFLIQNPRKQLDHIPPDHGNHLLDVSARQSLLQHPQLLGDPAVLHQSIKD